MYVTSFYLDLLCLIQASNLDLFSATQQNKFADPLSFCLSFECYCLNFEFYWLSFKGFFLNFDIFAQVFAKLSCFYLSFALFFTTKKKICNGFLCPLEKYLVTCLSKFAKTLSFFFEFFHLEF